MCCCLTVIDVVEVVVVRINGSETDGHAYNMCLFEKKILTDVSFFYV